jgi:hypothetical protein
MSGLSGPVKEEHAYKKPGCQFHRLVTSDRRPPSVQKKGTVQPAQETFSGIRETDANCIDLGGDMTEFLPRPTVGPGGNIPTDFSLIGACPNPVVGDTTITRFQIPVTDSVIIQAIPRPVAAPVALIYNQRAFAGVYSIRWGFSGPRGMYRVQMSTGGGFSAYGDVEFK